MTTWTPQTGTGPDGQRTDPTPVDAVYQAIGAASTCWQTLKDAGPFDDAQAHNIAEGLVAYLRAHPLT